MGKVGTVKRVDGRMPFRFRVYDAECKAQEFTLWLDTKAHGLDGWDAVAAGERDALEDMRADAECCVDTTALIGAQRDPFIWRLLKKIQRELHTAHDNPMVLQPMIGPWALHRKEAFIECLEMYLKMNTDRRFTNDDELVIHMVPNAEDGKHHENDAGECWCQPQKLAEGPVTVVKHRLPEDRSPEQAPPKAS